ncbi:MAG: protein-glutamate O-methyltransferase CheR [Chthoniobacterales bacterium]|nr:protein-glutamate O-methyltransferase CheR [Chthoniobacterales bacterium]
MADFFKDPSDIEQLSKFVAEHCGIHLGQDKAYLFQSRLGSLIISSGAKTISEFLQKARSDTSGRLRDRIIDAMTTHETYWFRDEKPWQALEKQILPYLATLVRDNKRTRVRIHCAACSTGQEPYSIAMLIDDLQKRGKLHGIRAEQFEILATDISSGTLALAMRATYNQIEVSRGLQERWRKPYFVQNGTTWTLIEPIRKMVTFKRFNLQEPMSPLGKFDLVLCRNVAIYFPENLKIDLFRRIADSLHYGGYLMLGGSEALLSHADLFRREFVEGSIFYRRIPLE